MRRTEVEQDRERLRCDLRELQQQLEAISTRKPNHPAESNSFVSSLGGDLEYDSLRRQFEQEREHRMRLQEQLHLQAFNYNEPSPTSSHSSKGEKLTHAYRARELASPSASRESGYVEVEGVRIPVVPEPENSFLVDEVGATVASRAL